ncbi:hypothetical protein ES703_38732 [subsurface metagenome]
MGDLHPDEHLLLFPSLESKVIMGQDDIDANRCLRTHPDPEFRIALVKDHHIDAGGTHRGALRDLKGLAVEAAREGETPRSLCRRCHKQACQQQEGYKGGETNHPPL